MVKQIFSNSDEVVFNSGRLFFGSGKGLINNDVCDYDNRINADNILDRFYIEDVSETLSQTYKKDKKVKRVDRVVDASKGEQYIERYNNTSNILAIKNLDVSTMKILLKPLLLEGLEKKRTDITIQYNTDISVHQKPPTLLNDDGEFYHFIDTIDLREFLGLYDDIFCCILPNHKDTKPSAGIIMNNDGHYIYNCFGCGFKGGIIMLIEAISGCSRYHAINFIKDVFNVKTETEWQKEQKAIIDENIKYIISGRMETDYPNLWKYVKPRTDKLILINEYAKNKILSEEYVLNDYPIFFSSLTYFMDLFNSKSKETTSKTIQLFALLNMLDKISSDDMPKEMLENAKKYKKSKKHKLVNHYQVKSYCYNQLNQAEKYAIKLKDNNFTMKGMSREWILRTFGIDVANEVYPQYKFENERGVSKKSDEKTIEIINVVMSLIETQGYATENEVVEILRSNYGKSKTEIQIKRSLQEILDSYDLTRIRANNQIKRNLGLLEMAIPF